MPAFSVIIPTLNEESCLEDCLGNLGRVCSDQEIIVVDGGSSDQTAEIARNKGARVLQSSPGRGGQCHLGAKNAQGEILVFLHADTLLPVNAFDQIGRVFKDRRVKIATFRTRFDVDHPVLRLYAFFTRFDSFWTSFGDQGIVIHKEFYHQLGGFPLWPLFEDVHLLRLARAHTRICSVKGPAVTSARKFLQNGIIRQQIKNGILLMKYISGVSPQELYVKYYGTKEAP